MKVESSVRGYFSSSFNSDIRGRGEGGGPRIASGYYLSLLAAGMCPRRLRRGSRFAKFEKRPGARSAVGEHSVVPTENGLAAWRERDALRRRAEDEPDRDAAAATASLAEVAAEAAL